MKKVIFALIAMTLTSSISMANGSISISHTSASESKVERAQDAVALEAAVLLMQGGVPSEQLAIELVKCRAKQAGIIGEQAASQLSDEALLLIISNK